jgi:hypothetical protein
VVDLRHEDARLWGFGVIVFDPEGHRLADDVAFLLHLLDNDFHGHICFRSKEEMIVNLVAKSGACPV